MAKRPAVTSEPLDIFSSPRFEDAMSRSTGPVAHPPESPAPAEVPAADSMTASPERKPRESSSPRRRVKKPDPPEPDQAPSSRAARDPNVTLKFRVPYDLRAQFQTFKAEFSATLGTLLDDSNLARPYLELLLFDLKDRMIEVAQARKGTLHRPAHGDTVAMAEFDEAIAEIIREAVRRRRAAPRSAGPSGSGTA